MSKEIEKLGEVIIVMNNYSTRCICKVKGEESLNSNCPEYPSGQASCREMRMCLIIENIQIYIK
jgi:hypothetical protein